jgi:hypothetical protein
MYGARAEFRDAILIAELNAIRVKSMAGLPFDPLYFCFFNDFTPELIRVDSGSAAAKHIEALMNESPASGQTDIAYAAISAFDSIAKAQGVDPFLAKATVVLVTDGEDSVDLEVIRLKQAAFGNLKIALSFISLGEENPDLKALVLEQREKGHRAFYHHLSDTEIGLLPSEFDSAWRSLWPAHVELTGALPAELAPHLEALEAIAAHRTVQVIESNAAQFDSLFPTVLSIRGMLETKRVERVADILDAVAETASLAAPEERPQEAVSLLLHLLLTYQLSVAAYLETLHPKSATLVTLVNRVRLLCGNHIV